MKKKVTLLYFVNIVVVFLFFIGICVTCRDTVYQQRATKGYRMLTEYEIQQIEDTKAPLGLREKYTICFNELEKEGDCLIFYSHHQNVSVYVEENLIFQVQPSKENPFGKTPGSSWNVLPIYQEDVGKEITIVLTPVYENVKGVVPEFYFGGQFDVWLMLVSRNALPLLLSMIAVIIGIVFIVFILYNYRNSEVDDSLMMMGFFAVGIGMWKIADMDFMGLVFPHSLWLNYLPYLALMLVVIPFALFVKELFLLKNHMVWYIICFLSLLVNGAALILQLFDIVELREMLSVNHLVMLSLVVTTIFMVVYEMRKRGWSGKLRTMLLCLGACVTGLGIDIVVYYLSGGAGMMVMGMAGFLVYIIVLGISSVREMKALMNIGMKAKEFEQMAYHDQLTGLYNRTAYAAFTGKEDFSPEDCIVVMFDLNDLKKCNDTRGHEKGDRYIVLSAKMIWRAFGDMGKCYRMGGDEFCALLNGATVSECETRIQKLKKAVEDCNRKAPEEFPIQIACGYERYDSRLDYDLGDTLRRADKVMYREKFMMKQSQKMQGVPIG